MELVQKLKFGVIAESAKPINLSLVAASVSSLNLPFAGMNSLSPCKIILFFDNDDVVQKALEDGSALWDLFDDLRGWIEGEFFDDRLMWIECFGIHPKRWTMDNIKSIGEKWGPVRLFIALLMLVCWFEQKPKIKSTPVSAFCSNVRVLMYG